MPDCAAANWLRAKIATGHQGLYFCLPTKYLFAYLSIKYLKVLFMSEIEQPVRSSNGILTSTAAQSTNMPHPLDAEWHVSVDNEVYGPFTGHELKSMAADGRLEYDGLVQKIGGPTTWIEAADDRALAKFFTPTAQRPNPPSVRTGDGAQIVTVNNTIAAPIGYIGERPTDKTPFMAAILSLLIVGIGQMYNGQIGKGILMMIGCILLWTVLLGWIINIWSIIDAYSVASRKHEAYGRWMDANAAAARANAAG